MALSRRILAGIQILGALAFGAAALLYAVTWTYYSREDAPEYRLGITFSYDGWQRGLLVSTVLPGSPAARAGLEADDLIVAINGRPLDDPAPFSELVVRGSSGDRVQLSIARRGAPAPLVLDAILEVHPKAEQSTAQKLALVPLRLYPVPFVLVGLAVLALRVRDPNAWLLATAFAALGCGAIDAISLVVHPSIRNPVFAYALLASGMGPAAFYALLARFPASSPLDRRVPWLKVLLLVFAAALWIPLAATNLMSGSLWPFLRLLDKPLVRALDWVAASYSFGAIGLGLLSLVLNCVSQADAGARRKARLVAWSFAFGFLPVVLLNATALTLKKGLFDLPFWFWAPCALSMMLMPVLFGYAVVRHRVLEFSVLVRRSARYLLVRRGFVLLAVMLSVAVTAVFVTAIARVLPRLTDAAIPYGIATGTAFGLVLFRTGGAVATRVTRRIDRAFFRSAYDARLVLEDLAERAALVTSRGELASLLERQLHEALHPSRVAVYLSDGGASLRRYAGAADSYPDTLDDARDLVTRLERDGRPVNASADPEAAAALAPLAAECAVPMLTRRRALVGVLAVGPRLSDELYSREDRRLLASTASQAGTALDNLMLAEEMAERIEVERRADQEVQIAAQVQRRLLPRKAVAMATVEYAGHCVQARAVGGDYYDFLNLGSGRLGLVLGDVSGKGLYAALLTTHLQASVRSLSTRLASEDLAAVLADVNRSFSDSTAGNHFATFFIGRYDDATRRLLYANCGHVPPVLCRDDGSVERLGVTANAVGLFEEWSGSSAEVGLGPGDLLAVFSDGVTEALNPAGEEFGEARLHDILLAVRRRPPAEVIERVLGEVHAFSGSEQTDDLTLVVVRGR